MKTKFVEPVQTHHLLMTPLKLLKWTGMSLTLCPNFVILVICVVREVGVQILSQLELELLGKLFTTISPYLLTEVLVTLVEEMCSPHVSVVFFSMEVKLGLCPRKTY